MRRSRIVALAALAPLAAVLVGMTTHESLGRWMEQEPVVVLAGTVGTPHTVGGPAFTVLDARIADPETALVGPASAPDGSQVVIVDVRIDDADDIAAVCSYRLEATVDGLHAHWPTVGGGTTVSGCYAEEGSLAGTIGFVVPGGEIDDARLLVGGEILWLGVPLPL